MISAVSCEASLNEGDAVETLYFNNPTESNSYNLMLGVAGPDGVSSGGFTVDVEVDVAETFCPESLPGETGATEWPDTVREVEFTDGEFEIMDSLTAGVACTNLEFASRSDVACFPATQDADFQGVHRYYALADPLPPRSTLTIWLEAEPGTDVNLYGYQDGTSDFQTPPAVGGVVACEASRRVLGDEGVEVIRFNNPSDSAMYNIFFAAAGKRDTVDADFTIGGTIVTGAVYCPESLPGESYDNWPSTVTTIRMDGDSGSIEGSLDDGVCTNLDFANDSQVACFPATLNEDFEGNQVYFAVDELLEHGYQYVVSVEGEGAGAVNAFGYLQGGENYYVPPFVPSALSCEYGIDPGDGAAEMRFTNPPTNGGSYRLFLAAAGGTTGDFEIRVERQVFP